MTNSYQELTVSWLWRQRFAKAQLLVGLIEPSRQIIHSIQTREAPNM